MILASGPATAQERRPSEEELFGGTKPAPPQAPTEPPAQREAEKADETPGSAGTPARPSEEDLFGAEQPTPGEPEVPETAVPQPQELSTVPTVREDPLAIGGMLYLRSIASLVKGGEFDDVRLSTPSIVDGYLDARPNDRVRGLLLARMFFDAAIPERDEDAQDVGSEIGGQGGSSLFGATSGASTRGPVVLLDQLWIRFDIEHTVFVTAGRQHVKWGTGHFWNPTDFLSPRRRDPLAVFDVRTGVSMLKLHVPWEAAGWNFYAIGLVDPDVTAAPPLDTPPRQNQVDASGLRLNQVGGAGRAEIVLGTAEFGIDAVARRGGDTRLGADFSAGVLDFDVYGEAALDLTDDQTRFRMAPLATILATGQLCEQFQGEGYRPSVTGGLNWSYKYSDEDSVTLGAEYFYNARGYSSVSDYICLAVNNAFDPFYAGRQYAGLYFVVPNPGRWNNTTFILSSLGNLSDQSFITRLDYQVLVLTYLRVEAFGQLHYGKSGEFHFGFSFPATPTTPAVDVAAPLFDLGLALNMSF